MNYGLTNHAVLCNNVQDHLEVLDKCMTIIELCKLNTPMRIFALTFLE